MSKRNYTIARSISLEEEIANIEAISPEEALTFAEENSDDYNWTPTGGGPETTYRIAEVIQ